MAAPEQCLQQRGMRATMLPAWRGLRASSAAATNRCSNTLLSRSSYGSSTGVTAGRRCTPCPVSASARGTITTHASPLPSASFRCSPGSLPSLSPRSRLALSHGSAVGLPAPLAPPSRVALLPGRWQSYMWAAKASSSNGSRSGATSSSSSSSSRSGSGERAVATAAGRKAAAATEVPGNGAAASGEAAAPAAEPSAPAAKRRGRKKQAVQEGVQEGSASDVAQEQEPVPLPQQGAVLLVGFSQEEFTLITDAAPTLFPATAAAASGSGNDEEKQEEEEEEEGVTGRGVTEPLIIPVVASNCHLSTAELLQVQLSGGSPLAASPQSTAGSSCAAASGAGAEADEQPQWRLAEGRVILLLGEAAMAHGAMLNERLVDGLGVAPAVVGCVVASQMRAPVNEVVHRLRAAHIRAYELYQPLRTAPGVEMHDVTVAMNVAVDAGEVPSATHPGQYRRDEGHAVVLDGLCSEDERRQILDWMTAPAHNHEGPPPGDRWEQSCVDRVGDAATWGLRPEVLQALQHDPPAALVAVQSRLAKLYPEYDLAHMPASQLGDGRVARRRKQGEEDEGEEEEGEEEALSSFVGNAVMVGDPCAYHVDADPSTFPPSSPWVHNFGYYYNREPGRPLFVSVLLYLNETWPEDCHAETLILDPESQTGVFVRPAPGRMLIMDQDVPHRISAPSTQAKGPRYSLVWKLVFFPRGQWQQQPAQQPQQQQQQQQQPGAGGAAGRGRGRPRKTAVTESVMKSVSAGPHRMPMQTLCRPEWGRPMRFGSAAHWDET